MAPRWTRPHSTRCSTPLRSGSIRRRRDPSPAELASPHLHLHRHPHPTRTLTQADAADVEALRAKLDALKAEVDSVTIAFREAVEADKAKEESALEAAAAAAAAERAANGEDDDHDTRKLKYPDRLRLVTKNKEEGTELFQGGNFRPAAARYNKALTHAAKFVDLSPDQRAEVDALKLSLHLNIAVRLLPPDHAR